jgi:hypothetical protein
MANGPSPAKSIETLAQARQLFSGFALSLVAAVTKRLRSDQIAYGCKYARIFDKLDLISGAVRISNQRLVSRATRLRRPDTTNSIAI